MKLGTLFVYFLGLVPLITVFSAPQYRQRLGETQGATRYGNNRSRGRGGGGRGGYGRRRPAPVVDYDDGTDYEDSYESVEDRRTRGRGRGGGYNYRSGEDRNTYRERLPAPTERQRRPVPPSTTTPQPETEQSTEDDGGCGPDCRNLLHEVDHRKEDSICPYEGMVVDIYGYCR